MRLFPVRQNLRVVIARRRVAEWGVNMVPLCHYASTSSQRGKRVTVGRAYNQDDCRCLVRTSTAPVKRELPAPPSLTGAAISSSALWKRYIGRKTPPERPQGTQGEPINRRWLRMRPYRPQADMSAQFRDSCGSSVWSGQESASHFCFSCFSSGILQLFPGRCAMPLCAARSEFRAVRVSLPNDLPP